VAVLPHEIADISALRCKPLVVSRLRGVRLLSTFRHTFLKEHFFQAGVVFLQEHFHSERRDTPRAPSVVVG
jgi:hypothetical protein